MQLVLKVDVTVTVTPIDINVRLPSDSAELQALTEEAKATTQRLKDALVANSLPTPPA